MADGLDTEVPEPGDELAERFACCLFRVSGVVQGVFFRASTQTAARDLGISGYAKNCTDGTVEVLACGEAQAVDKLLQWLWRGPDLALVESVDCQAEAAQDLKGFITG